MKRARVLVAAAVLCAALAAIALRTCAPDATHERTADPREPDARRGAGEVVPAPTPRRSRTEAPAPVAEAPKPADTGSIVGVALGTDGKPAGGAKVRAAPGGDEKGRVVAQAGPDGAFRIAALAPGRWTVACAGGGFGTRIDRGAEAAIADVVAGAEVRVEVRGEPLAIVAGHVTGPDGRPVANARVQAQCDAFLYRQGCWRLEAKTGDDGAYEFANISPGEFVWLFFSADGFATEDRRLHEVQPASRIVVDVALARAVPLELRLVAADDGTPVSEAFVWIHDAETGFLYDGGHGDSFAPDANGRVLATMLRPRPVRVQIDAKGFVRVPDTAVDPATQQGPRTFRLTRAMSIAGRLVHADGTAAAGEWVRAALASDTSTFALAQADRSGVSGADGAFRVDGLLPGRYRVGVCTSNGEEVVAAEADAGATDVLLTIPRDTKFGHVRVRVVGPDGQDIPGARIRTGKMIHGSMCSSGGGVPGKGEEVVELAADVDAFIEVWDARDAHRLRLPLGHVLTVVPRDAKDGWTVALPPERTVAGRVVGPGGEGVEGATIEVVTVPRGAFSEGMSQDLVGTTSAARGAFRVVGLGDDRVRLTASADGSVGAPVEADAGATDVTLRLSPEAPAAIRVVDPDGRPVAEAGVMATPARGVGADASAVFVRALTDADGRARLRGLAAGQRYRLVVSVPGARPKLFSFEDADWAPADAEIRLAHAYAIEGVVRDASGKAVEAYDHVVAVTRNGEDVATALVVEEGRFRALVREPGRYAIRVVPRGDEKVLATAEAEADGAPVTIEVRAR
jgi:hypothetical protein